MNEMKEMGRQQDRHIDRHTNRQKCESYKVRHKHTDVEIG